MLSIGIKYSAAGAIAFQIGTVTVSLSGLAVGALVGIIMNAVLPEKDYNFDEEEPSDTGVCFAVKGEYFSFLYFRETGCVKFDTACFILRKHGTTFK